MERDMAEILNDESSSAEKFVGDYLHTFARLLDPNLPASNPVTLSSGSARWPLGQTVAFVTIASLSVWAMLAGVIYYFA